MPTYNYDFQVILAKNSHFGSIESSAPSAAEEAIRLRSLSEIVITEKDGGVTLIPRSAVLALKVWPKT